MSTKKGINIMHILSIALRDNIDLLRNYLALDDENLDIMTYSDFKMIFTTCNHEISKIVYETYSNSDECHAAAICYMNDTTHLTKKRLVEITNIPKEDIRTIIESNLAVFSTYHLIDDIPLEYISLITPDIVDTDELVFILPLSSREEIVQILERNPSLSCLFGPYLSCTINQEYNLNVLREHDRIIEVKGYEDGIDNDREISLDELEDTPLETYLKTGEGKDDIVPEYEDVIGLETLQDIERIYALGPDVYNKLDINLDMDLTKIPPSHLMLINEFENISRCIDNVDLKDAINWFKYIDNAELERLLNYSSNREIEDNEVLQLIWSKYYNNVQLNKIVLSLLEYESIKLDPKPDAKYLNFV